MRESDMLVGRGEAVGVDALGGGEAEALADGGDLAQFFLALLKQISLEVAFKLAQCGGSLCLKRMKLQYIGEWRHGSGGW